MKKYKNLKVEYKSTQLFSNLEQNLAGKMNLARIKFLDLKSRRKCLYALYAKCKTLVIRNLRMHLQHLQNPFLKEWNTPYGLPPFSEIQNKHYLPALDEGIKQHSAEIQAIIDNPEEPTFENTIEVFDHSGKLLAKVVGVLFDH